MRKTVLGGLAALVLVGAGSAHAATCADRQHVVTQLHERFGEELVANAVSRSGNVLQVYASKDAETWSILVALPERDLACLAATGRGHAKLETVLLRH
jgi:hypothetical protein